MCTYKKYCLPFGGLFWGFAAEAQSPSFDCNKAHFPDEYAICRTPELAELDNLVAAGYAYLKSTEGRRSADEIRIPFWRLRHACGSEPSCIRQRQVEAIIAYHAAGAPVVVPNEPKGSQFLSPYAENQSSAPYAPVLTIVNNTCHEIAEISIDGSLQNNTIISSGQTGLYTMKETCSHVVEGKYSDLKWTNTIQCQNGVPLDKYTLNWVDRPNETALEGDILKVTANKFDRQINVTSKSDCLAIERVTVNRGNCEVSGNTPKVLKFGETIEMNYTCQEVLEVKIDTDQGVGVYTFE